MPELLKIVDPNKQRLATARRGRRSSVVAVDVGVGVDGCATVSGVIPDFLLGNSSPHESLKSAPELGGGGYWYDMIIDLCLELVN